MPNGFVCEGYEQDETLCANTISILFGISFSRGGAVGLSYVSLNQ